MERSPKRAAITEQRGADGATTPAPDSAAAWLARYAGDHGLGLKAAVAAGIGVGLCVIAQAMGIAWIVNGVVADGRGAVEMAPIVASVAGVMLLRGLLQYTQQRLAAAVSQRQLGRIRSQLLSHLHGAGSARIGRWHQADLASRAVHAVDAIGPYIASYLPQRTLAVIVPLMIGVTAAFHDWLVAALLLLSAPLIPLFMALVGWGAERLSARFETQRARAAGVFGDRIRGLLTIRLFNAEQQATQQVRHFSEALRMDSMRVLRVAFLSSAVLEFFAAVAVAAVAIYVGMGLLGYIGFGPAGALTLYSGLCVLLLAPEFFVPLRQLATHYHDRAAALGAAEQLAPLFALATMADRRDAAEPPIEQAPAAVLQEVWLKREHGTILRGTSLHVAPGQCLLLWGPSGCGKTSILHLLAGHLEADAGTVGVAGQAPGQPRRVAWLGQRPFLAHGSIAYNIALGRADATEMEITEAARRCGVLDFAAALPEGLDTRLGERGVGLSGGQAQRVAVARAWLTQARLTLADEPTAGLDQDAAQQVIGALAALTEAGRSLIIASHDPALRALADQVLDLSQEGSA